MKLLNILIGISLVAAIACGTSTRKTMDPDFDPEDFATIALNLDENSAANTLADTSNEFDPTENPEEPTPTPTPPLEPLVQLPDGACNMLQKRYTKGTIFVWKAEIMAKTNPELLVKPKVVKEVRKFATKMMGILGSAFLYVPVAQRENYLAMMTSIQTGFTLYNQAASTGDFTKLDDLFEEIRTNFQPLAKTLLNYQCGWNL